MKTFPCLCPSGFSRAAIWLALFVSMIAAAGQTTPPDYSANKAAAEKFYAEGSYAKANGIYQQVILTNLPSEEQRWVNFRLADTQWRSAAATDNPDTTKLDAARESRKTNPRPCSGWRNTNCRNSK